MTDDQKAQACADAFKPLCELTNGKSGMSMGSWSFACRFCETQCVIVCDMYDGPSHCPFCGSNLETGERWDEVKDA